MSNKSIKPVYTFWNNRLTPSDGADLDPMSVKSARDADGKVAAAFTGWIGILTLMLCVCLWLYHGFEQPEIRRSIFLTQMIWCVLVVPMIVLSLQLTRYNLISALGRDIHYTEDYGIKADGMSFEITFKDILTLCLMCMFVSVVVMIVALPCILLIKWALAGSPIITGTVAVWGFAMCGLTIYSSFERKRNRKKLLTQASIEGE